METFEVEHRWTPDFMVLTVPMRNGNNEREALTLGFFNVLTVPMRNGNLG